MTLRTAYCKEKEVWKWLILSTVMRTVNELIVTITVNVTIWTTFFRRTIASFISFLCILQTSFAHALIFNELPSETGPTVPVLSNAWT
jgi:hypothetical protein